GGSNPLAPTISREVFFKGFPFSFPVGFPSSNLPAAWPDEKSSGDLVLPAAQLSALRRSGSHYRSRAQTFHQVFAVFSLLASLPAAPA
ncbi:hypothetical protein, partial [Thalassospira xiamenensis]|uniref:hypothetical protein n=1 Tax=Thalassospira xiamenensis TaxID=220697 RepID=UPI001C689A4E